MFILAMDQMATCKVKGMSHSDESTENYHPTLQLPSALQSVIVLVLGFVTILFRFSLSTSFLAAFKTDFKRTVCNDCR